MFVYIQSISSSVKGRVVGPQSLYKVYFILRRTLKAIPKLTHAHTPRQLISSLKTHFVAMRKGFRAQGMNCTAEIAQQQPCHNSFPSFLPRWGCTLERVALYMISLCLALTSMTASHLPPDVWHFFGRRKVYGRCL